MSRFPVGLGLWCLAALAVFALAGEGDPSKEVSPNRNLVNTRDRNVPTDFCVEEGKERNLLWKARLGKTSWGGPVVAGGRVFVGTSNENPRDPKVTGDKGVVMCFDAATGRFLWQITHDKLPEGAANGSRPGVASTPYVDGERLYYISNRCELVCADVRGDPARPGRGKILWSLDMVKELKVFPHWGTCFWLACSSPLVADDLVFVVTGNGRDDEDCKLPSPGAPSFVGVDKHTGRVVWKDASPGQNIMEGSWGSPAYARPLRGRPQVIFPGGDGWLYAFEPRTGRLVWKFDCNPKDAVYDRKHKGRNDRCYLLTTPAVWEDRCYIGVGSNPLDGPGVGHLWCVDLTGSGDVTPRHQGFDPDHPKNRGSALVWHFGGKVTPRTPEGRDIRFGRTLSTCAIHDGLLYVAELDGYLHCLDARTGKQYWVEDLRTEAWSSPYWADGKVFLGTGDGELLVFAHGKKPGRLGTVDVGAPLRTSIKVAGGVLYIMTESYLYAVGRR
jgi:outer membrane protein assembly factor BamB